MKKTQRLTAVFLLLLILCGCSTPTAPDTIVMPQTSAETRTEPAPVSAEPEPGVFHLEYEQTALPEPLSAVTALTVLDGTFLLGGVSETGLALVRLTAEGKSEELPLPGSTEYLYALCPDGAGGAWLLCGSLPKGYFDAFGNFRFLSKEPEGKFALAHYDAAFALQEIVLLQTQYTDRFFQLCRLEGGFCMMSASLLIRLDEAGAETSRQSLDAKDGWSFHDESKTSAEIVSELYGVIREAAGDAVVIACNAVSHLSAGIFEVYRTGDDTSGRLWSRTRAYGVNTLAFRLCQNNAFYKIDADCVGIIPGKIDWSLNRQWLEILSVSGSPLFISVKPDDITDGMKEDIKKAFFRNSGQKDKAEPLDWLYNNQPQCWLINGEKREYDFVENSYPELLLGSTQSY